MDWNTIDDNRYKLLKDITQTISIPQFYMIGGTALSLQLGLRESYDFDFCVPKQFNNELLLEELGGLGEIKVKQNQKGTCDITLKGVQVSFFYYPNKVLKDFVTTEEMPKLKMASILDIAIMKIVAIGGRGSKKDFFDLYHIMNKCEITVEEIAKGLIQKCGEQTNYVNIIMGLSYFEDAEQEELPRVFVECNWENIKDFFIRKQQQFKNVIEKLTL